MVLTFDEIQIDLRVIPSVLVERFDAHIMHNVLNTQFGLEKDDSDSGEHSHMSNTNLVTKIEMQRRVLEKYARNGGPQGRHATKYFRSQWGKVRRGRRFAAGAQSLQSFAREIRHTVSASLYFDADMENCHPVLLACFCAQHGIECPWLNKYNLDRSGMFASLIASVASTKRPIDRKGCKELVLKILNGGRAERTLDVWGASCPPWLHGFCFEMASVRTAVKDLFPSEFVLVQKELRNRGKEWNCEGTLINRLMNVLEDNALQYIFKFFLDKGMEPGVLCFDGLMVPKTCTDEAFDSLCTECTAFVQKESGYPVIILRKEMDEGFLPRLHAAKRARLD
jgi:hypothetical protein